MILTCPACNARYVVDPALFGARSRQVRCAKCSFQWQADPVRHPDTPEAPLRQPEPAQEPRPIPPGSNLPIAHAEKSGQRKWLLAAVAVLILGVLVVGGIHIWRQGPLTAELLNAGPSWQGLTIENVKSEQKPDGSLVVNGLVANRGSEDRIVPMLEIRAYDAQKNLLHSWQAPAQMPRLAGGELAAFSSAWEEPGQNVAEIAVTFAQD